MYSQVIPPSQTFNVTLDDPVSPTNFVFSGGETGSNPTLELIKGETYKFIIDTTGFQFWIKTANTVGSTDALTITDGITNNGTDSGIIYYTVPETVPNTLYYKSDTVSALGNSIGIILSLVNVNKNNTFEEWRVKTNVISDLIGDFSLTTNYTSSDVLARLDEIRGITGELSSLTTVDTTDLVTAINELETNHNTLDSDAQLKGNNHYVTNLYLDSTNTTTSSVNDKIELSDAGSYLEIKTNITRNINELVTTISNNGTLVFSIDGSGDAIFKGDVTAFGTPSDINMKENIEPITNALDKVCQIGGYTFDFKEEFIKNDKQKNKQVGVIAQELEKVLPELVHEREDGTKRVDYDRIVALLIEAIKELNQKIK